MRATDLHQASLAVGRILRDRAYSNVLSSREGMSPRARALMYDVIRHVESVDDVIAGASSRSLDRIEPSVLDLLRVAVCALTANPAPPVVDSAVRVTKSLAPGAAGFVNAVLRKVSRKPIDFEQPPLPPWLHDSLRRRWDDEEISAFWEASHRPARTGIRIRPGGLPPESATPFPGIEHSYLWDGGQMPANTVLQDPASVAVGQVTAPRSGDLVLEIGAARGGKASHLGDLGARVVGIDISPNRVSSGKKWFPEINWVIGDGLSPPFSAGTFDVVLLDAPCSGLGTLRRRPEVRLRVTEERVHELARLQTRLLDSALDLVAEGGRVVYSVCTVTPEETVDVVAGRGFRPPILDLGREWEDGRLLAPHLIETDGMFIAIHDNNASRSNVLS